MGTKSNVTKDDKYIFFPFYEARTFGAKNCDTPHFLLDILFLKTSVFQKTKG